jgi:4-amino-4-deoxy-L-arabinose transferase-like glycosyltransferase
MDASQLRAPEGDRRDERARLVLFVVFGALAAAWALLIPVPATSPDAHAWDGFNPDEQIHLRLIAYMATRHALPFFGAPHSDTIYTVVHPPLYHVLAAIVYAAIEPALGYPNTVLILRLLTCLLGIGTVAFTYRAARYLFSPLTALLAAGFVASVPMFVSLSAAVSNEVPAAFAASGALCAMAKGLRRRGFATRDALVLALWVTAACAIKVTCFTLIPAALLALWLAPRQRRQGGGAPVAAFLRPAALLCGVWALGMGWWLIRNQLLYGDPMMAGVHYRYWAATVAVPWQQMMTVPQFFWNSTILGWISFWGVFDGFTRPLPDVAYIFVLAMVLPAAPGFVVWIVREGGLRRCAPRRRAFAVLALFAVLMMIVFYAINLRIYAPQGRYLLPLLAPFGLATAAGWLGWLALLRPAWRRVAVGLLIAACLLLNIFALVTMTVRPDKAPPNDKAASVDAASHIG